MNFNLIDVLHNLLLMAKKPTPVDTSGVLLVIKEHAKLFFT